MTKVSSGVLHWSRFVVAVFCLLVAAGHLAYTIPISASSGAFAMPTHTANTTNSTSMHYPTSGGMSFNTLGFWFDVEVVTYIVIAVVFLLGLRTWYIPSILFNILNMVLYFGLFPSHLNVMLGLTTTNLIELGWVVVLIGGLLLIKYDPGSELNKLLVARKQ